MVTGAKGSRISVAGGLVRKLRQVLQVVEDRKTFRIKEDRLAGSPESYLDIPTFIRQGKVINS